METSERVVTGGWRRLHNEEYNSSSSLPNIMLIKLRMGGVCGMHGRDDKCM